MNVAVTVSEIQKGRRRAQPIGRQERLGRHQADDKALKSPCEAIGSNATAESSTAIQPSPAAYERTRVDASTLSGAWPGSALDRRTRQVCALPAHGCDRTSLIHRLENRATMRHPRPRRFARPPPAQRPCDLGRSRAPPCAAQSRRPGPWRRRRPRRTRSSARRCACAQGDAVRREAGCVQPVERDSGRNGGRT